MQCQRLHAIPCSVCGMYLLRAAAWRSMVDAPPPHRRLACSEVHGGTTGLPGFEAGLPLFVGGISLGGCIAFNAALADREAGSGLFRCVGEGWCGHSCMWLLCCRGDLKKSGS